VPVRIVAIFGPFVIDRVKPGHARRARDMRLRRAVAADAGSLDRLALGRQIDHQHLLVQRKGAALPRLAALAMAGIGAEA
jgi:hypothetical protein